MTAAHVPVLLHEVIGGLSLVPGAVVVDATLGAGGYARAMCDVIGENGTLVGLDQDAGAVLRAKRELSGALCTTRLFESNFREIDTALMQLGVREADAIVFDLGLSSIQIVESGRGFSFQQDEPLLMTFKEHPGESDITARQIVNDWSEEAIANVLFGYGEERYARRIAKAITEAREKKTINMTGQLVEIIKASVPVGYKRQKINPATRAFQALRIAVNDEVSALEEGLTKAEQCLTKGGHIAVISFHSIEDRVVKRFFAEWEKKGMGRRVTKKPVTPSEKELAENPRSRSAKLRIFQKTAST
ncbi:16S rRNA (cytosine(1402)-N(4))-methyltransferase RsmH [Candidatus Wolfebacteria bacterium]|nr:16S rRNA (cytosine(1402)-N(4))-methyltransferase RsmH [Candidatus Wolfebacteria bacterium]